MLLYCSSTIRKEDEKTDKAMQDDMAQVGASDLQGRDIQDARLLRRSR